MARPRPEIIMKYPVDKLREKNVEIVTCEGVFVVTYDGQPFNYRVADPYVANPQKYRNTTYVNSGHAANLAERLNKWFKTDKFQVMTPTGLEEWYKDEQDISKN